jgi:hypothetical protein
MGEERDGGKEMNVRKDKKKTENGRFRNKRYKRDEENIKAM